MWRPVLHEYSEKDRTKHYFLSETCDILGVPGTLGTRSGKEGPKGAFPGELLNYFGGNFGSIVVFFGGCFLRVF